MTAKCQNYTGCLLAYRGEEIQVASGAPLVCPECGKPVVPMAGGAAKVVKWVLALLISAAIIAGAVAGYFYMQKRMAPLTTAPATADIAPATSTAPTAVPSTAPSTTPTPERPASTPAPETSILGDEPAPATPESTTPTPEPAVVKPKVVEQVDTSLDNEQNQRVKEDVLKRIDLMPNISATNKDKLYNSVTRARGMGLVLQIPFGSGKTALLPAEVTALKAALEDPKVMSLRDDPTAVFVVLGYADSKGDDAKNIAVSQARADSVVAAMRDKCNVANVTHPVAMGGSTLHDATKLESNRVAEVWAVLP